MPGVLLDCFYIVSSAKSIDHICMAEIMESMFFNPGIFQLFL